MKDTGIALLKACLENKCFCLASNSVFYLSHSRISGGLAVRSSLQIPFNLTLPITVHKKLIVFLRLSFVFVDLIVPLLELTDTELPE